MWLTVALLCLVCSQAQESCPVEPCNACPTKCATCDSTPEICQTPCNKKPQNCPLHFVGTLSRDDCQRRDEQRNICTGFCYSSTCLQCAKGYYGHDCDLRCPGGPENVCNKNGECNSGVDGTGECTCFAGFSGLSCDQGSSTFSYRALYYSPATVGLDPLSYSHVDMYGSYFHALHDRDLPLTVKAGFNTLRLSGLNIASTSATQRQAFLDKAHTHTLHVIPSFSLLKYRSMVFDAMRKAALSDLSKFLKIHDHEAVSFWCIGDVMDFQDELLQPASTKGQNLIALLTELLAVVNDFEADRVEKAAEDQDDSEDPKVLPRKVALALFSTSIEDPFFKAVDVDEKLVFDAWILDVFGREPLDLRNELNSVVSAPRQPLFIQFSRTAWHYPFASEDQTGEEDQTVPATYISVVLGILENLEASGATVIGHVTHEWTDQWWRSRTKTGCEQDFHQPYIQSKCGRLPLYAKTPILDSGEYHGMTKQSNFMGQHCITVRLGLFTYAGLMEKVSEDVDLSLFEPGMQYCTMVWPVYQSLGSVFAIVCGSIMVLNILYWLVLSLQRGATAVRTLPAVPMSLQNGPDRPPPKSKCCCLGRRGKDSLHASLLDNDDEGPIQSHEGFVETSAVAGSNTQFKFRCRHPAKNLGGDRLLLELHLREHLRRMQYNIDQMLKHEQKVLETLCKREGMQGVDDDPEVGQTIYARAMNNLHHRLLEGYFCWLDAHPLKRADYESMFINFGHVHHHIDLISVEPQLQYGCMLLYRLLTSVGEHIVHCPERLAQVFHMTLMEFDMEEWTFTVDMAQLQLGLATIHGKNISGINFDDINDCGASGFPSLRKTFHEAEGVAVLLDIIRNYNHIFFWKGWMFAVALWISSQGDWEPFWTSVINIDSVAFTMVEVVLGLYTTIQERRVPWDGLPQVSLSFVLLLLVWSVSVPTLAKVIVYFFFRFTFSIVFSSYILSLVGWQRQRHLHGKPWSVRKDTNSNSGKRKNKISPLVPKLRGQVLLFWFTAFALTLVVEAFMVAKVSEGVTFASVCSNQCVAGEGGACLTDCGNVCTACQLSVLVIYLLMAVTVLVDTPFIFNALLSFTGYYKGQTASRNLRNCFNSNHVDLRAAGDHRKAMVSLFGAWDKFAQPVWHSIVMQLKERDLISDADRRRLMTNGKKWDFSHINQEARERLSFFLTTIATVASRKHKEIVKKQMLKQKLVAKQKARAAVAPHAPVEIEEDPFASAVEYSDRPVIAPADMAYDDLEGASSKGRVQTRTKKEDDVRRFQFLQALPRLSHIITCYSETVLLSLHYLLTVNGKTTNMQHLLSQPSFKQEWAFFVERFNLKHPSAKKLDLLEEFLNVDVEFIEAEPNQGESEHQTMIRELVTEVRFWTSNRSQTVGRTMRGALTYHESLVQRFMQYNGQQRVPRPQSMPDVPPPPLSDNVTPEGRFLTLDNYVELIIAHQTYTSWPGSGQLKASIDQWVQNRVDMESLMHEYQDYPIMLVYDYTAKNPVVARPSGWMDNPHRSFESKLPKRDADNDSYDAEEKEGIDHYWERKVAKYWEADHRDMRDYWRARAAQDNLTLPKGEMPVRIKYCTCVKKMVNGKLTLVNVIPRILPLRLGQKHKTQGKSANQMNALRLVSGHVIQVSDANMDGFIAESFKLPFVTRMFLGDPLDTDPPLGLLRGTTNRADSKSQSPSNLGASRPKFATVKMGREVQRDTILPHSVVRKKVNHRIIGFREYIFTGDTGVVGRAMAASEFTFGTMFQRVLADPLGARMHYGHPDFFDAFWVINRGSLSKASPRINLSEDIFSGFNAQLRGEDIAHVDMLEWQKGRETVFIGASQFLTKISSGSVAMLRSRDMMHMQSGLDLLTRCSLFYGGVGTFLFQVWIDITITLYVWAFFLGAMGGVTRDDISNLDSAVGSEWLISFGFISVLPLLMEFMLEYGWGRGLIRVMMDLPVSSLFHLFQNKCIASTVKDSIRTGEASYIATGRPNAFDHYTKKVAYQLYACSHYTPALEILMLYILYNWFLDKNGGKMPMFLVLASTVTWLLAPVLFCPQKANWTKYTRDVVECFQYLLTIGPGKSSKQSMHTLWIERQQSLFSLDSLLTRTFYWLLTVASFCLYFSISFANLVDSGFIFLFLLGVHLALTVTVLVSGYSNIITLVWIFAPLGMFIGLPYTGPFRVTGPEVMVGFVVFWKAVGVLHDTLLLLLSIAIRLIMPVSGPVFRKSLEKFYTATVAHFNVLFLQYHFHLYVGVLVACVQFLTQLPLMGVALLVEFFVQNGAKHDKSRVWLQGSVSETK